MDLLSNRIVDDIICQFSHWKNRKLFNQLRSKEDGYYSLKGYDRLECIFVHIPKAAGISINMALFENYGGGHKSAQIYKRIFGPIVFKKYYKFTFVRNPYSRLLSAYKFLKKGGFHLNDKETVWAEENLSEFSSFDEFVRKWLNEESKWSYTHFKPQYIYVCDNNYNLMMDFVGRFENLDNDFDKVCQQLNIKNKLQHHNKTSQKKENWKSYYSDYSLKKVGDIYRKDFEMFNYERF